MTKKIDFKQPWTSETRYQTYADYTRDYVLELTSAVQASSYHNTYHIEPETGLLNDPNGFSYFNGKYHLFYQIFPYGPVHGLKSWALTTSTDLIHWQNEGLKLLPDTIYDAHGAYSGSALPLSDDQLFLFYTGNTRGPNQARDAYQNGAIYHSDGTVDKFDQPLLRTPYGYTDHFRDPMIFQVNDQKFAIIGAQKRDETGAVVLAQADNDSLTSWHYKGELNFTNQTMGYMIECPNLVFIDKRPILLFCPQGLDKSICDYDNVFPNMYVIADYFDTETGTLNQASPLKNLDDGFEIYATQAFNAPDGRVLASSWLGLPDLDVPSQADGWQGVLSLVKSLTLKNGHLYQYPVTETLALRQAEQAVTLSQVATRMGHNSYELELDLSTDNTLYLFASSDKTSYISLKIDTKNGKIELNRENLPVTWAEAYGYTRTTAIAPGSVKLNIFTDTSSLEIFVNTGEKVMSSRIFTDNENTYLYAENRVSARLWQLKK